MEYGRQAEVRIAQPGQQRADCFEAKPSVRYGQRAQPIKLRLNARTF